MAIRYGIILQTFSTEQRERRWRCLLTSAVVFATTLAAYLGYLIHQPDEPVTDWLKAIVVGVMLQAFGFSFTNAISLIGEKMVKSGSARNNDNSFMAASHFIGVVCILFGVLIVASDGTNKVGPILTFLAAAITLASIAFWAFILTKTFRGTW